MPPKGKGKQSVSIVAVPQYTLPASPPTPAPIPLKPKAQGTRLVASNYGVSIIKSVDGTLDFVPRSGAVVSTSDFDRLSDAQKALAQTVTEPAQISQLRSVSPSSSSSAVHNASGIPPPIVLLSSADGASTHRPVDPSQPPNNSSVLPNTIPKKIKHYATAGGCTPYSLMSTQDGLLLEVGTLEDGCELVHLNKVPTREQAWATQRKAAQLKADLEAAEAAAASVATLAPTRRSNQLASLAPTKNPHRLTQHSSTSSKTGAAAPAPASGVNMATPADHGTILSLSCGALHAVWVAIAPGMGRSKVWGVGCVEDHALSLSAARAAGVVDYIPEGQPIELQALSDEGITQVWASGSVTFARGRRGLFAVGTLGDHMQWIEPCLLVPALVNQISPLSPVEEAVSVGIGASSAFILMSNGDILALEEEKSPQLSSGSVRSSSASPGRDLSASVSSVTGAVINQPPVWRIRNVTFELFPRARRSRRGSAEGQSPLTHQPPRLSSPHTQQQTHGANGKKFKEIHAGKGHFVMVDLNSGQMYGWGLNSFGQLGPTAQLGLEVSKAVLLDVSQLFGPNVIVQSGDLASSFNVVLPSTAAAASPTTNVSVLIPPKPVAKPPVVQPATPAALALPPTTDLAVPSAKTTARSRSSLASATANHLAAGSIRGLAETYNSTVGVVSPATDLAATMIEPVADALTTVAATCSSWATIVYLSDGSLRTIGRY